MIQSKTRASYFGLENHGLSALNEVYWNLYPSELIEQAISRSEGKLANQGAFVVYTGKHTGRSPNDRFFVQNNNLDDEDIYWGKVNRPITLGSFDKLYQKIIKYFEGKDVFVQDMQVGAHPAYNIPIRVISERAWASLFARDLFIRLPDDKLANHIPQFTVLHAPQLMAEPKEDGTVSPTFIVINLTKRLILIGGTNYAGEIKKSIFTVMNYLMPRRGILSMHCSANMGNNGDVALFFGLSGTGKTTLSSDPERQLIGDDEHGWSDEGIFNFEGGCYAKIIKLDPKYEPLIFNASQRFGAVLENVVLDPLTRIPDFDDGSITENTRGAYPLNFIQNYLAAGYGGHPDNVFFLTADAFGVLPPISLLTKEQALYYFLSGYTSKLAGTEVGLGQEPEATFSTCFGAPFMPLNPSIYADLLGSKIIKHHARVWLLNTGWTGGPYGVGKRFQLTYTRAMIHAALNNLLDKIPMKKDPFFGLTIPAECPGVPSEVLEPRNTWQNPEAYDIQARMLIQKFEENSKQFIGSLSPEVLRSGPHL